MTGYRPKNHEELAAAVAKLLPEECPDEERTRSLPVSRNGWALTVPLSRHAGPRVDPAVFAQTDVYVSGVVQGEYLYNTNDDIESSVADARVDLDIGFGEFTMGAVYRAYQLSDPLYNPAGKELPEVAVEAPVRDVRARGHLPRAGHFFATFGHGLTMRSYENADLEHDTALDGLMIDYEVGAVGLTALMGTMEEDASGTRYYTHTVRGARATMPVTEWLEIAGSMVERSRELKDEDAVISPAYARFEDGVRGAEVSAWVGRFTFAGEFAGEKRREPGDGRSR